MSGYPYGGNPPQYPPPQNQIYPQIYNPANAPPPGQPAPPSSYPVPGQNPQYQYQPSYQYQPYPGQPGQPGPPPSAMSYPVVAPSAPMPNAQVPAYGFPGFTPVAPTPTQTVEWVLTTPQNAMGLSDRAVVAGYEGYDNSPLWVIRARFQGDLIPGKLAVKHASAYVPWNGQENSVRDIEVCCARSDLVRWIEVREGSGIVVPPKAVQGGHTASGEPLYIGRAKYQGALTPGKVHPSHKVMYLSFGGLEHAHKSYEVLCTV